MLKSIQILSRRGNLKAIRGIRLAMSERADKRWPRRQVTQEWKQRVWAKMNAHVPPYTPSSLARRLDLEQSGVHRFLDLEFGQMISAYATPIAELLDEPLDGAPPEQISSERMRRWIDCGNYLDEDNSQLFESVVSLIERLVDLRQQYGDTMREIMTILQPPGRPPEK